MPTDLTERLAAAITRTGKKITTTEVRNARWIQEVAPIILPLLLSEPELVASLPDAVRVKALESLLNAAPVMESAFVDAAEVLALAPEELRLSVLTPRERAVMKLGEACVWRAQVITDPEAMYNEKLVSAARVNVEDALADARALTTEGKDG